MSRWFVGSSSTRQFAPARMSSRSSSRVRSPPERSLICWRHCSYVKRNRSSAETASSSVHGFCARSASTGVCRAGAGVCSCGRNPTSIDGPTHISPSVGSSSPESSFTSTLLPDPLSPITPIRSPRKTVRSTPISTGSAPNATDTSRHSATRLPPRTPLRSRSAILRRSSTGRSTLSMRSIRRWVLRARVVWRGSSMMLAHCL